MPLYNIQRNELTWWLYSGCPLYRATAFVVEYIMREIGSHHVPHMALAARIKPKIKPRGKYAVSAKLAVLTSLIRDFVLK